MTIDFIAMRHGKKISKKDKPADMDDKDVPVPGHPGDQIDRERVCLSPKGRDEIYELSHRVLNSGYGAITVVTSNFLRTGDTVMSLLKGAGYDPETDLHGDGRRFRIMTDSYIGLGGTKWEPCPQGVPKFSDDPKELTAYVNALHERAWLEDANEPVGNPNRFPVMARRGSALLYKGAEAVEDVAMRLKPGQRGLVAIVTHCPTVDAFQATMGKHIEMRNTGDINPDGRELYDVCLVEPMKAYTMGEYMLGSVEADSRNLADAHLTLNMKGKEVVRRLGWMRNQAADLSYAAAHGCQRNQPVIG
jgi:hypothetical protein